MINYSFDWLDSDAVVHVETNNDSFLKMSHILCKEGIRNNQFFLALYDKDLIDIDPHAQHLPPDVMFRIAAECRKNPWYFFREIVRIPSPAGEPCPFGLNKTSLAQIWLMLQHINQIDVVPRQCGDLATITAMETYWMYIWGPATGCTDHGFYTRSEADVKNIVKGVKNLRDLLPPFLWRNGKQFNNDLATNIMYFPEKANLQQLRTVIANRDFKIARNHGSGESFSSMVFDQAAECINVEESMASIFPTLTSSLRHGVIITTRPGYLKHRWTKYIYNLIQGAYRFDARLYDLDSDTDLRILVGELSSNGFIHVEHSAKELGKDEAWHKHHSVDMSDEFYRKDILLEWIAE